MSRQGQANYSGVNAQSWAAMSLFLQFLKQPVFSHIVLEGKKFEDFTLIFSDGKKIICESKHHKKKLSFSGLKEILSSILLKQHVKPKDEILIVCSNLDHNLESATRHVKYFKEFIKKFTKKGFSKEQVALLPQVRFWRVSPEFNAGIIYDLFFDLINFWIPSEDVKRIVDSILIQKIYKGSAKGVSYSKVDLLKEIDKLREMDGRNFRFTRQT